MKRAIMLLAVLAATLPLAHDQDPLPADDRFAGMQWNFARIKYNLRAAIRPRGACRRCFG